MSEHDVTDSNTGDEHAHGLEQHESGYGYPAPEDEVAPDVATNPGPADPLLRGQQTDEQALDADPTLGMPEPNFAHNEDAGSDGEPGAGRLGGTDDQFLDEMTTADPDAARIDAADEAHLDDNNAGATRPESDSFSSEADEDASGE